MADHRAAINLVPRRHLRIDVKFFCSSAGRRSCEPVEGSNQRGASAHESLLVAGLVVRCTVFPTTKHDASALEGQGADGGVMVDSLVPLLLVRGLGQG